MARSCGSASLARAARQEQRNGTGSNPSPVTDGKHVVVYFKSGTLACLDVGGSEIWKHNLQDKYGEDTLWWDLGTSPVLVGGRVVVAVMHEGPSYLVAFDLANGEVAWKQEREYDNERESDQAYTTPQVVQHGRQGRDRHLGRRSSHGPRRGDRQAACGNRRLQSGERRHVAGDRLGGDRATAWRSCPTAAASFWPACASAARATSRNRTACGRSKDAVGRRRADARRCAMARRTCCPTAARSPACDLRVGEELWSVDLPRNRNKYYASPVLAGDKLYCTREDGTIFVGRVTDDGFEQLAENDMGERIIATPVPIRGGLLDPRRGAFVLGEASIRTQAEANNDNRAT